MRNLISSVSPHFYGARTTKNIMLDVILALIPALVVSIWLSALLGVPYPAMAASLLVGQAICGAVGALLVSALRYVWKEK